MLKALKSLVLKECKICLKPSFSVTSKRAKKKTLTHDNLNSYSNTENSFDTKNTSSRAGGFLAEKSHSNRSRRRATSLKINIKIAVTAEHAMKMNSLVESGGSDIWRLSDIAENSPLNTQQQQYFRTEQKKSVESSQLSSRERRATMILCKSVCDYPPFQILSKNKTAMIAAAEFSEHCCMTEVFSFLCAVLEYGDFCKTCPREKQYCAFLKVAQRFIVPGSPLEINISSTMREKITKLTSDSAVFFAELPRRVDRLEVFQTVNLEMERLFWFNVNLRKNTKDQKAQTLIRLVQDNQSTLTCTF